MSWRRKVPGQARRGTEPEDFEDGFCASDVLKDTKAEARESEAAQWESSFAQYHDLVERYFRSMTT